MTRVFVTCPETKMALYTGMDMDKSEFESSDLQDQRVKCSHCGQVHVWQKEDAFLIGSDVGS